MKDYDEERRKYDGVVREFKLAGETFQAKPVMAGDAISELADIETGSVADKVYERLVGIIRRTLRPESREAFDELLGRDLDVPIELKTLMAIAEDLVQELTGRPSQPPSPSGSGDGSTSTPSTDGSGSTAEAASPISTSEPR